MTGVQQAITGRDPWWRSGAMRAVKLLAEQGQPFDAYDVTLLDLPDSNDLHRWGGLFKAAQAAGLIVPVGFHKSKRPGRAGGVCRVWLSTELAGDGAP